MISGVLAVLVGLSPMAPAIAQDPDEVMLPELDADDYTPYEISDPTVLDEPAELPQSPAEDPTRTPISLPGGQQASASTPQAIQLPNAEGSIEGMGESFAPILSSGTATFSVPIAVAPGRAGVQPSFALSYSTTSGNGPVGFGWSLGAPFISRQTDRGLPRYVDGPRWHAEEDRFIYNGGQELVPVDAAAIEGIEASAAGRAVGVPTDVGGWQQYRARVEGGFMRFFRAPTSDRWVVQSQDGTRFDFGLLPSSEGPGEVVSRSSFAVERDPERTSGGVYRWMLTRMSDAHGSAVYYLYDQDRGQSYLAEVYYVSPASCAAGVPETTRKCREALTTYGARVRFVYEPRSDVFSSYVSGWRIETARRLRRVEITAYDELFRARTLVRRYHLRYSTRSYHSLLEELQVEGRPQEDVDGSQIGSSLVPESVLGELISGALLPPMRFTYTAMPEGEGASTPIAGFGGISTQVRRVANSPPHSADEARSDLFDVNSDGLPDLIVTDPARYRTARGEPAVGVFFNGFTGADARPAGVAAHFSSAIAMPMRSDLSSVLSLSNANVVPMDIDGDGRSDLLHMPRTRTYGWWAPTRQADGDAAEVAPSRQGWAWTYAEIDLPASDTDPRIDLGRDSAHLQTLDVNNDHLIDIVRTTGTGMQTWINLGNYPGGDGRFGSYRWNGVEWELSTLPVTSCLLHAGVPLDFEDPEVRIADMNGDGILDIAKVRRGRVLYWPGRGEGSWGDGPRVCTGTAGGGRYIEMSSPPAELNPELEGVFLTDVNMDGASDLVQVRFREIDVWFNRGGRGWTARTIARNTPFAPAFAPRIRFADIDGSSTTDLVWASAGDWQYIDPSGGRRPRLLVGVDNGLGAETTIAYGSSADDYLIDLMNAEDCAASGCERFTWGEVNGDPDARLEALSGEQVYRSAGSPVISTVVRSVETSDRFDRVGRSAQVSTSVFAYHDGYYEGIEQEFRGFGAADAISIGDVNNPTVHSRTHFLQGRRPSDIADDRLADNPDEALKGREVMTEVFDANGVFLSTSFATITNRHMLTGLDGREIHYAFVSETNELRYDTYGFVPGTTGIKLTPIVNESLVGTPRPSLRILQLAIRGTVAARIRTTFDEVDALGHVRRQTAHGQLDLAGNPIDEPIVSRTVPELVHGPRWIWRTDRSFVTGSDGAPLADTTNTYNEVGDLTSALQNITIPMAFEFLGSGAQYGEAAGFTQTAEDVVASTVYDDWGNALASCAGAVIESVTSVPTTCLRFGHVDYDTEYAQIARAEHVRVTEDTELSYRGSWDRGLGAIMSVTDPNELVTRVTYDGLGRLTSVSPPNVAGCASGQPTTRIAYELTDDPAARPVSRVVTTTILECDGSDILQSIAYVDGLGRVRAALATGEDENTPWVRSGIATLDTKGTVRDAYQTDFFAASDLNLEAVLALPRPGFPFTTTRYDAFGRVRFVADEEGFVTETRYFALATEVWDPLDLNTNSPHSGTPTTAVTDGHGRVIDQILRNAHPAESAGTYRLWTYYRADGAVLALVRAESEGARPSSPSGTPEPHVLRTFTYDSAGRRLASDDPDTNNPLRGPTNRSWRYLFNRVGDLVAVRDPRGCGQNFFYDFGGRLVGEQYMSCGAPFEQVPSFELPPEQNDRGGLIALEHSPEVRHFDVIYHYDETPAWALDVGGVPPGPVLGRATGVTDRGQRAALAYDDRGNVIWTARQIALIPPAYPLTISIVDDRPVADEGNFAPDPVEYDETNSYVRTARFDHAGRPRAMTLPRDPDYDDADPAPVVGGLITYNNRGLPAAAAAFIGCEPEDISSLDAARRECASGTFQTIVEEIEYERDGLVANLRYGDHGATGGRMPTEAATRYDRRRRPIRMSVFRQPDVDAVAPELGAVTVPFSQELTWDPASNLTYVRDLRLGHEWPAGYLPQSVDIEHDSLYRVVGAAYQYTQPGGGLGVTDDATDWRDSMAATYAHDPMRTEPAPSVSTMDGNRVVDLRWSWDYLANTTEWNDDSARFYERSIGNIVNGEDLGAAERPSAIRLASNLPTSAAGVLGDNAGWLEVDYGSGGNIHVMTVHGQCADVTPDSCVDTGHPHFDTRRTLLRQNCACASEQHYEYRWDELNRLIEARRYDRIGGGDWQLQVRQRYRYDAANQRVVKQTLDQDTATCGSGAGMTPCERVALYVYPGDFERRGLVIRFDGYEADAALGSETQYVLAGARTVWTHGAASHEFDEDHRLTVVLSDLIQTNSAVMDVRTGELLETSTYYPNGARETYRVDDASLTAPDVAGFTGKEGDDEVGLVYFGERYLVSRIGRWASPDPLHVHDSGGGEALNSYHYVSGNLLIGRDAFGLDEPRIIEVNTRPEGVPEDVQEWSMYISFAPIDRGQSMVPMGSNQELRDLAAALQIPVFRYNPDAELSYEVASIAEGLRVALNAPDSAWADMVRSAGTLRATDVLAQETAQFAGAGVSGGGMGVVSYAAGLTAEQIASGAGADRDTAATIRFGTELATPSVAGGLRRAGGAIQRGVGRAAARCRGGVCPCFVSGTVVHLVGGETPIDRVAPGDVAMAARHDCQAAELVGWSRLTLVMDGPHGDVFELDLLRPREWIELSAARIGAFVHIELEELNVEGSALVTSISDLSRMEVTGGCLVSGTIRHRAAEGLVRMEFVGVEEPLVLTPEHRLWSRDRDGWIEARWAILGEEFASSANGMRVSSLESVFAPDASVHNLEILGSHEYLVHTRGILTHNTYATSRNAAILRQNMAREGRAPGPGEDAGHIVPSAGVHNQYGIAVRMRQLLAQFRIGVNDAANGIPVRPGRAGHSPMHTRAFLQAAESRLNAVVDRMRSQGYGFRAIRAALRRELRAIGRDHLDQIGP